MFFENFRNFLHKTAINSGKLRWKSHSSTKFQIKQRKQITKPHPSAAYTAQIGINNRQAQIKATAGHEISKSKSVRTFRSAECAHGLG